MDPAGIPIHELYVYIGAEGKHNLVSSVSMVVDHMQSPFTLAGNVEELQYQLVHERVIE